ncbi:hypothetical protein H5410_036396 [Solanum commersonii]|uniref:Secreted protein n=1 Tax=Solanum commersonii TaxID=4109 RepID=A0A9J5Y7C5_SOLCO|nr:hypothetical protein H5410_036396 [Solanum commersonii]
MILSISLSVCLVSVPSAAACTWASVPVVTSQEIAVPNPLGVVVDLSIISSSCIAIFSSSISTSDSSSPMPSLYASVVVARGISEMSGASSSSVVSINELKLVEFR